MHIFLGLIFIILAIVLIIMSDWIIENTFCSSDTGLFVVGGSLFILLVILFGLAIIQFSMAFSNSDKLEQYTKEYPASEYHMSIKTTTMDNKTDTTYVISKIK